MRVWWERLAQDVSYAIRTLRMRPAFTLTAIACLALGIGANIAIFSVIHKVLLEPLPYPEADRIVIAGRPGSRSTANPQRYGHWTRSDHGLELLTAFQAGTATLVGGDWPELVKTIRASHDYFRLFGAHPILGRTFNTQEDRPGGHRVAVMSHRLWQQRFGGDPNILGKAVTLGDEPHAIIGVLAPRFVPYPPADIWIPLQVDPQSTNEASTLTVAGRLPPGTTLAGAHARMHAVETRFDRHRAQVQVASLRDQMAGEVRPLLLILLGAVGLVLLIACGNVANLLLARAAGRQHEFAIRAAIGAGRARLVRQLVTESVVLALGGAVAGLLAGRVALGGLLAITPDELPRAREITTLDPWVVGFAVVLSLTVGVLAGLVPAARASRTSLPSARRIPAKRVLVAGEIATALVLLTAALLMIRSFVAMRAKSLGFDSHGLLTVETSLAGARYQQSSAVDRLSRQVVAQLAAIPGVESAAMASALPLFGHTDMVFDIPGRARPPDRRFTGDVQWRFVTPDYFRVLAIPLLAGRRLTDHEAGRVVVISQSMARRFWPDGNPVGENIVIGGGLAPDFVAGPTEIVGVVGDVRERLDHQHGAPVMYQPASQIPDGAIALMNGLETAAILVRTRPGVGPATLGQPVKKALESIGRLPATNLRTMEQAAWDSTPRHNFNLFLFGAFAAVAVLLAAVGIYGVTAYSVGQKRREIGIRTALGATRGDVFRWVERQALATTAAGVVLGTVASLGLTRFLRSLLFGVTPLDTFTFIAVPLIAALIALAAAAIPAWRASRTDPVSALRMG